MKKITLRTFAMTTMLVVCFGVHAQVSYVTIPDGNPSSGSARQPLGTWWGFERSHMLYLASEINRAPGQIFGLAFYVASVSSPGDAPTQVYLKNSTLNSLSSSTVADALTDAELVYDATIPGTAFVPNDWINIDFSTPFNYNGENLEVVVLTNATGAGNEGSTGKRFRYSTVSGRFQTWNTDNNPPTGNGTLSSNRPNIRLTFPPQSGVDLAFTGLITPGMGCYSDAETISVGITNNSVSDLDFSGNPTEVSLMVYAPSGMFEYTFILDQGTLASGETYTLVVDTAFAMSDPGVYTFNGTLILAGDQAPGNNVFSATRTVVANMPLPISQNFSGYNGANLPTLSAPNDGWVEATGAASPIIENGLWTTPPAAQAVVMGGPSARFNIWSTGNHGWIISPQFVAGPNTELSFDAAIFAYNTTNFSGIGSDDIFAVRVSTDCGLTYQNLLAFTQSSQAGLGLTNSPQRYTVDLSAFAGQQLRIAFFASSGTVGNPEDYDVNIANILIRERPAFDLSLSGLAAPSATECYDGSFPVVATVLNSGMNPFDFSVSPLMFMGTVTDPSGLSTSLSFTVSDGVLNPGQTTQFDLGSIAAQLTGVYAISLSFMSDADTDAGNNSFSSTTYLNVAQIESRQNFTGYTGLNLETLPLPNNGWAEMILTGGGLVFANSPWTASNATQTSYFGTSTARINLWTTTNRGGLLSAPVKVENNTKVFFDVAITTWNGTSNSDMGSDDVFQVYALSNCGQNLDLIYELNAANKTQEGITNQFKRMALDVCQYAGQAIEILFFASDGVIDNPEDYDIHLDNVFIGAQETCDIPTTFMVGALTSTTATFSWSAVDFAKQYEVRWRPLFGGTWSSWVGMGTSATITGLTPQIRYVAQVRALCSDCGFGSEFSAIASFTTPATPVAACVNPAVSVTPSGSGSAVVGWTPVAGAFNYIIQWKRADVSGVWTTIQRSAALDPSITLTGLTPGVTYLVRVRTRCTNALAPIPSSISFSLPSNRHGTDASSVATVYPNPSSGVFYLTFHSPGAGSIDVTLYDLLGKAVLNQSFAVVAGANELTFGSSTLAKGVYLLRAVTQNQAFSEKVVVE